MFATDHWKYVLAALVLHVAIAIMLTVTIRSQPKLIIPSQLAIQGVIVDHSSERMKRERAEKERLAKERAEAEAAEKQKQIEAERQEAERKETERKETERKENDRKEAERKATERQAQIAAQEKQRQAEQEQRRASERKQRETQEADAKKRVAEIKEKQAEKLRSEQAAREQAQRESELKRQLADEEGRTQAKNSGLLNQYALLIAQRVERNWNKPPSAAAGIECTVTVNQAPGGSVLSVLIGKCNGDAAVRQSIEAAVYRSSPLPPPPDARLFERVIVFVFKPSE